MALILDDRTDVWPSDMDNLIKVKPYYFFHQMAEVNNAAGASITVEQAKARRGGRCLHHHGASRASATTR